MKGILSYQLVDPQLPNSEEGWFIENEHGAYKINDISLPLDYQASLGTFDALLGLDFTYKKLSFDAAFQLPFWHLNKNSFFAFTSDMVKLLSN